MHKRRVVSAASLAVIGFALSACNGDDGESAAKESPAASASASAPASSEPSSESPTDDSGDGGNGGEAPAGDVTAPGTKLKTGDRA
ncbi:hypothetical protein ACN6LK_004742, partial [Streptomyces griseus]